MTELQKARADYIAALEREVALEHRNAELTQLVHELKMSMVTSAFQRYVDAVTTMATFAACSAATSDIKCLDS